MTSRETIDHVVTTTAELLELFPAEKDTSATPLTDGETVYISETNAPYRPDRDLRIHGLSGLTVLGSGRQILIKPATPEAVDVTNPPDEGTRRFVITGGSAQNPAEQIRFDGIGYDGNARALSDRLNVSRDDGEAKRDALSNWATPFVVNWTANDVTVQNCHVQNTFPREHNQGGSAVIFKSPREWVTGSRGPVSGHRVINCTFDHVGDRSIQFGQVDHVAAVLNRATNGFDRMITMAGTQHAYVAGNVSIDTVCGSAFGANDGFDRSARNLTFSGNWGLGMMRNLFAFEGTKEHSVDNVFCYGNHKIPERPSDDECESLRQQEPYCEECPDPRNTVHQKGDGTNHVYLMNYAEENTESGYEIRFDNTRLDWNIEIAPERFGIELWGPASPADCKIGHNNIVTGVPPGERYEVTNVPRPRVGGVAVADGPYETPGSSWFEPGEVVEWTDTREEGSGTGVYLLRQDNSGWYKIADASQVP